MIHKTNQILNKTYKSRSILYRIVPFIVLATSTGMLLGWYAEIATRIDLSPTWTSVRPVTSICFLVSSLTMMLHVYQKPRARAFASGIINCLALSAVAAWWQNGAALNIVRQITEVHPYSLAPGVPSWMTIFGFLLFSLSYFMDDKRVPAKIIMTIALVAILGYGLQQPLLFYYVEDIASGMTLMTALLFFHMGAWLYPWKKLPDTDD